MKAVITKISKYIPERYQTSSEIEQLIRQTSPTLKVPEGIIEILTNIKGRPVASDEEYPSVLAAKAGKIVLDEADLEPSDIDLILFASAGQDILEPATGNLVQDLLGATCPIIDVKNACNSFLNGLEVARAFILSGQYSRILVTTGETPSKISQYAFPDRNAFRDGFIGLTLGDAGAAAIVEKSETAEGIYFSQFTTQGKNWELATLPGGGARHPFGDEFTHFKGDGMKLKDKFIEINKSLIDDALASVDKTYDDFAQLYIHQVSYPFLVETVEKIGAPMDKVFVTIKDYGNLVSASLPSAISLSLDQGKVNRGDHVLVLGLASGISVAIMMIEL
jgi:3-oxoacyl-[acyl-carrier-protein] synthase-3